MNSDSAKVAGGGRKRAWIGAVIAPVLLSFAGAPTSTESAIANGDTRTISLSNSHTNESGSFTYKVNGYYDTATLDKLNWFLRDWRINEPTKMDPRLFDILWEVYRQSGCTEPIDVLSGYRSPQTNAMLRRRSRLVAEHSQHMQGKAMDAHFVGASTATVRDISMRLQAGGTGFYPIGSTPWIHVDSGSVRYWPRMSRDALTRLFPDGKTVFIPSDGEPLPGYELARAEIEARGGEIQTASNGGNFGLLGWLFGGARGGGADDAEESGANSVVLTAGRDMRSGQRGSVQVATAAPDPIANAKRDLPQGETFMRPAPKSAAESAPAPAPEVVASLETNTASDAEPVTLHGPIAAKFIAPLPPRKPAELAAEALAFAAPMPPPRPQEFGVAAASSKPADADMIAALLERGKLPGAITQGVAAAPASALALVGPANLPDSSERLARAAALVAPLPPPRPTARADGLTAVSRSIARPPVRAATPEHGASLQGPYGGLVLDAFNTESAVANGADTTLATGLRGSTQ